MKATKQLGISNFSRFTSILALLFTASMVQAASDSYFLDQSNKLPDGTNYLQVTISDSTTIMGDIDFTVDVLASAFTGVNPNIFGMNSFSFNFDDSLSVSSSNINIISPTTTWQILEDENALGGFGKFNFEVTGEKPNQTQSLKFSITGVAFDSLASYAVASTLAPSSGEFFAAQVIGFNFNGINGAKFAGSTPVPVPAAFWLFGTALLGVIGVSRRRKAA